MRAGPSDHVKTGLGRRGGRGAGDGVRREVGEGDFAPPGQKLRWGLGAGAGS